nr:reverse transcriptase domain-containing protein [Tanacetum cinerariifolium]
MAPKRTTRANLATTTTTTTTTSVTDAQLKALIEQGVARALATCDANRNTNGDDNYNSGTGARRTERVTRECTYPDFMKCKPLNFKGIEGVVELTRLFKKIKTVFRISNCSVENQIKFSTCTLLRSALMWWNSHVMTVGHDVAYAMTWTDLKKKMTYKYCPRELALLCVRMFLEESDKIERYIGGLPDMIHGSVVASNPRTMQEAIEMATEQMDKKIRTFAKRQTENKRKQDDNNNQAQQQPLKKSPAATNNHRNPTCYQCGNQGHYRSDCPELKNQDHGNQARGTGAHGMVKERHEKDKIGSKPDKNGKRSEARKNQKQSQSREKEKMKKIQVEGPEINSKQKVENSNFEEHLIPVAAMTDNRTMAEMLRAPTKGCAEAIVVPPIFAEQFKLKHSLINIMTSEQFFGLEKDNPHDHIRAACRWLEKEPSRSITTWDDLVSKFINEFFPLSRTTNLRTKISNFQQIFDESFHEAWERYKDLLRACPHHGFTELHQLDTFYNALNPADQDSFNAAAGGNLLEKSPQDTLTIIENKSKQTSAVTTAMMAMLKQLQANPPPAQVKAVEEICVTCGDQDSLNAAAGGNLLEKSPQDALTIIENKSKCLAAGGNTFLEFRDSIQGYVLAAAGNYNQGNPGYCPQGVANQIRPPGFAQPNVQNNQNQFGQPRGFNRGTNFNQEQPYQATTQSNQNFHLNELEKIKRMNDVSLKAMQNQIDMELANTPLNENCSAVILKKLPEKLGDPRKFLIPCGFNELKCKALADLGSSINLMPPSVWKKLGLPDLIPTCMTLELANRAICTPDGIVRDVFIPVGKFTFPADFVVVDYESDPKVPLILGRPFLRTARALIDVHGEEMILCDGDERLTLNMKHDTASYSNHPHRESVNLINIFNIPSEDCLEVLVSNNKSGNPTFSLHKEIASPKVTHEIHDSEGSNFVVVDYESDPRVPLILRRPFLRTACALIDVHGEEMILRNGDERLTLNMKHDTASYSNHPHRESFNLINIFNIPSEDCLEVSVSHKQSGNPTLSLHKEITSSEVTHEIHDSEGCNFLSEELPDIDSFNDIHPHFDDNPLSDSTTYASNSLLEEFTDELALITYPPDYDDNITCDIESDLREIEFLLYQGEDSDLKDSIDQTNLANLDDLFVDPTPEMFNDEHAPDYSFPSRFDVYDDDFLEIESDADTFYADPFDSKGEKIKESELLIDEFDLPCDILPYSENDSFASQDFSRDDDLPSPNNEDKVKERYEKDKIRSKPDKKGKRGKAQKSQKQSQSREKEKMKKIQVEGSEMQNPTKFISKRKRKGMLL